VVYEEERGLSGYDHTRLHSFEYVEELGRREMRENAGAAGWWLDEIARGQGSDVSVMLYTSGTTGRPKGVVLTHDNIVLSAQNGNKFDNFTCRDTLLAYLPMAWVGDHIFSYGQAFAGGMCVACPESPETDECPAGMTGRAPAPRALRSASGSSAPAGGGPRAARTPRCAPRR